MEMESEGAERPKWLFGGIFAPNVDFYALLNRHAAKTLEGMQALYDWVETDPEERCTTVRQKENEADDLMMQIGKCLVESFITPFDREDIYDISARMDEVINAAKGVVREIEAFDVKPSKAPHIRDLTGVLVEGTQCLVHAIACLKTDLTEANRQASLARKAENRLTKAYRIAMSDLFKLDDMKEILRQREVYKSLLLAGERIDHVGEKLLHAIMKMS